MNLAKHIAGTAFLLLIAQWAGAVDWNASCAPVSVRADSKANNSVQFNEERQEYFFSYKDDSFGVEYTISSRDTNVLKGMISVRVTVNGKDRLVPIYQAGPIVRESGGKEWFPADTEGERTYRLVSHEMQDNAALLNYEEIIKGQRLYKTYRMSIRGKTLIMEASASVTNATRTAYYAGFDIGKSRLTTDPVMCMLPSVPLNVVSVDNQYFISTYVDPLLSSTGSYDTTDEVIRARSMQASNTPAWLVEDANGKRPPLHVISYLTVSDRVIDVAPVSSIGSMNDGSLLRDKVVVDLHQLPFAYRSFTPVETIRRWESPEPGWIDLEGAYQLYRGDTANCSVFLLERSSGKERLLFSQILDSARKISAGIKGRFPVEEGDQLLFSVSGPAVMTGGEVVFEAKIRHNDREYHSFDDFFNEQGVKNWYYEQRIGTERSLMVWNPEAAQWESPFTRSYQNAGSLVCRAGAAGDASIAAAKFFDELRLLGISNQCFLTRGWSDRVRFALPPDAHHNEFVWGTAGRTIELTKQCSDRGGAFVPVLNAKQLGLPDFQDGISPMTLLQTADVFRGGLLNLAVDRMRETLAGVDGKIYRKGLWLESPSGFDRIKSALLYYQLLGASAPSSCALAADSKKQMGALRELSGEPLLLDWKDSKARFDYYGASLFDGLSSPLLSDSNALNVVDEELWCGRRVPRVGFGSYSGFYQNDSANPVVDLRLFPLDQYMTSTIAYGRVPYLSGKIWFPGFKGRDVRRHFLECIALLQPVEREYLHPKNDVVSIRYQTVSDSKTDLTAEEVIHRNLFERANRIKIQYANGLRVNANRSEQPWSIETDGSKTVKIAKDGFVAFNPVTRLFSLIGMDGDRTFSVRRTPKSFFLHSRDGAIIRFESFSTDGMMHRWRNEFSSHCDMACLAVTEVNGDDPRRPMLRANRRVDCCVQWMSNDRVDIHILEADEDPVLLEYFDLPQEWLTEGDARLSVLCRREGESEPSNASRWYTTSSGSFRGVRFFEIQSGDCYTISYASEAPAATSNDLK